MEEFFAAVKDAKMRIWGQCCFIPEGLSDLLSEKLKEKDTNKCLIINILLANKLKEEINKIIKEINTSKEEKRENTIDIYKISKKELYDTYFIIDDDTFVYSSILNQFSRYPNIAEKGVFQMYWSNSSESL